MIIIIKFKEISLLPFAAETVKVWVIHKGQRFLSHSYGGREIQALEAGICKAISGVSFHGERRKGKNAHAQ